MSVAPASFICNLYYIEELNNNEELHRTVSIGAEKLFQKLTSLEMFRFEFLRNL